jgi:VanZ family protein
MINWRWLITIAWMVVIYIFSDAPHSSQFTEHYFGILNIPLRKLGHLSEYAILFWLCNWSLLGHKAFAQKTKTQAAKFVRLIAFVLTLGYAITDEWHQSYVPGRSATIGDVAVDAFGAAIAWGILIIRNLVMQKLCQGKTAGKP